MDMTTTATSRLLATTPVATTARLVAVVPEEVVVEEVCFAGYSPSHFGLFLPAACSFYTYDLLSTESVCMVCNTACKQERKKVEKRGGHDIYNIEKQL